MVTVVRVTKEQRDAAALRALRAAKLAMRPTPSQRSAMRAQVHAPAQTLKVSAR